MYFAYFIEEARNHNDDGEKADGDLTLYWRLTPSFEGGTFESCDSKRAKMILSKNDCCFLKIGVENC